MTWLTGDPEGETSKIAGVRDAAGFPGFVEITGERGNGWEPQGGRVSTGDSEASDAFLAVTRAFPHRNTETCLGVARSWQLSGPGLRSFQVSREAWSAMFVIFGLVDAGVVMGIDVAQAGSFAPDAHLRDPVRRRAGRCSA